MVMFASVAEFVGKKAPHARRKRRDQRAERRRSTLRAPL
jgi:hypothetical protein